MEAYHIDRFGSVDRIVRRSSDDPRPGPREILMRVRASSLNYRDLMVLKGGSRGPTTLGVVPLSDGAGEVAAIGERVTRVKVGDRIIGTFHPRWFGGPISADYLTDRLGANLDGMLADYAVLSEEALVPMPGHLSFRAASLAPRDRPDIPFRRGKERLPAFRGPQPFRQGRHHMRLNVRLGAARPAVRHLVQPRQLQVSFPMALDRVHALPMRQAMIALWRKRQLIPELR